VISTTPMPALSAHAPNFLTINTYANPVPNNRANTRKKARGERYSPQLLSARSQLALLVRPRGNDPCHAGIGDKLAHVLVRVDDDAQVHPVYCRFAILNVHLALQSLWCFR
jgi:hypothetical protein